MLTTYVTRRMDLGEPIEVDIRVSYRITTFGWAPIVDRAPEDCDPGAPNEIEIDDACCIDWDRPLSLLAHEIAEVEDAAKEYSGGEPSDDS